MAEYISKDGKWIDKKTQEELDKKELKSLKSEKELKENKKKK